MSRKRTRAISSSISFLSSAAIWVHVEMPDAPILLSLLARVQRKARAIPCPEFRTTRSLGFFCGSSVLWQVALAIQRDHDLLGVARREITRHRRQLGFERSRDQLDKIEVNAAGSRFSWRFLTHDGRATFCCCRGLL